MSARNSSRPLISYEPNPALGWLYGRVFEHIEVDESWAGAVREADSRGTVVYVLRNLSFLDFLALDYLTKRLDLPRIRFANDLGLWILEPMGRGWFSALKKKSEDEDAGDLRRAVEEGSSAALFLKRPPTLREPGAARGRIEGDVFMRTLLDLQHQSKRPILLVPQVFVWSKQKDDPRHSVLDLALGPREWPGKIRSVAQLFANYRKVTLRAGEPINLSAFLAQEAEEEENGGEQVDDEVLVRRLTYTLLRRLERERRAVLGPTKKPSDRLREEVIRSPRLQKIIGDMAGEGEAERRVLTWRAMAMLREMEADLDMTTIDRLRALCDRVLPRLYSAIGIDEEGLARLREASKDGTIILLPSHKSHIDYIVLAYVLYTHHIQLPIIAAGDNLAFFPLGNVLRRAGAFFIRRSFAGDRLYGAAVDAYMRRLIIDGWWLEFFLEGGRSRTGKLLPPKLGLLNVVVDAALGVRSRKTYFAPLSIGYDRVVEEQAYVHELSGGEKKKEDVRGLLASAEVLKGRYGRLSVQFGELFTLDEVLSEIDPKADIGQLTPARRRALVSRVAYRAMNEINQVTAVTPGALVATALLTHEGRGIGQDDLVAACRRLATILHGFGARFSPSLAANGPPGTVRDEAIREACELFIRAGHLEIRMPGRPSAQKKTTRERVREARTQKDGVFVVPDEARLSLDLSKNVVVHFFVSRAMVAIPLAAAEGRPMDIAHLKDRVLFLSRLFKYEFQFRADASFDQIFDETIAQMTEDGELLRHNGGLLERGAGEPGERVLFYARVVRNFVEGYRVAARGLTALLKGPLATKDLGRRAMTIGEKMFLAGEVEKREAVCRPVVENAFSAFVNQGYLSREQGKLALPESYARAETLRTVEASIASFLGPPKGSAPS